MKIPLKNLIKKLILTPPNTENAAETKKTVATPADELTATPRVGLNGLEKITSDPRTIFLVKEKQLREILPRVFPTKYFRLSK